MLTPIYLYFASRGGIPFGGGYMLGTVIADVIIWVNVAGALRRCG